MGRAVAALRGRLEGVVFVALVLAIGAVLALSTRIVEETDPAGPPPAARSGALEAVAGDALVVAARSESGRRRDRVRVAVPVRLRNNGARPVSPRRALRLSFAGRAVRPDPRAEGAPGVLALTTPLPAGGARTGELRFELAGADTEALRAARGARLVVTAPGDESSSAPVRVDVPVRAG